MEFEFATANRIVFGAGRFGQIGNLAKLFGRKAFIVTGHQALKASGKLQILEQVLTENGLQFSHFAFSGEPDLATVELAVNQARLDDCDLLIGVGGGSVIDLAKAVAGLLTNDGCLLDYLEVVGKGDVLQKPAAPFIAVPTTAGTGAEVTANAVIKDHTSKQKVSFRSPFLLPRVALIDPELTYSMSPEITAQSGLDALIHLIEGYTSKKARPLIDPLCKDGVLRVTRSLVAAYDNGANESAREDMALASLEGGIVLANAGLGAVHGIAAVLGGSYPIPHGVACACLLPYVFEANVRTLNSEGTGNPIFRKYLEISEWLGGGSVKTHDEKIGSGLTFIQKLNAHLKIPGLSRFGVGEDDVPEIARKAAKASSTTVNPVTLSQKDLTQMLKKAFK